MPRSTEERSSTGLVLVIVLLMVCIAGAIGGGGWWYWQQQRLARMRIQFMQVEYELEVLAAEQLRPLSKTIVVIQIDAQGNYIVEDQITSSEDILAFLKDKAGDHPTTVSVKLEADTKAPLTSVTKASALCEQLGIENMSLSAKDYAQP